MPEAELVEWCIRSERVPLWPNRLEVMLAQVAMAASRGPVQGPFYLRDFMLFRDKGNVSTNTAEENANILAGIAGGAGVRRLGQGRRKRTEVH